LLRQINDAAEQAVQGVKKTGLDFQDFVVRRESPVELLRKQLTTADP